MNNSCGLNMRNLKTVAMLFLFTNKLINTGVTCDWFHTCTCEINYNFIFCSWLSKLYVWIIRVSQLPCTTLSPQLLWIIESTLCLLKLHNCSIYDNSLLFANVNYKCSFLCFCVYFRYIYIKYYFENHFYFNWFNRSYQNMLHMQYPACLYSGNALNLCCEGSNSNPSRSINSCGDSWISSVFVNECHSCTLKLMVTLILQYLSISDPIWLLYLKQFR